MRDHIAAYEENSVNAFVFHAESDEQDSALAPTADANRENHERLSLEQTLNSERPKKCI